MSDSWGFIYFLKVIIISNPHLRTCLEGKGRGEGEGGEHQSAASLRAPTGRNPNPDTCPDGDQSVYTMMLRPTEPHRPGTIHGVSKQ